MAGRYDLEGPELGNHMARTVRTAAREEEALRVAKAAWSQLEVLAKALHSGYVVMELGCDEVGEFIQFTRRFGTSRNRQRQTAREEVVRLEICRRGEE